MLIHTAVEMKTDGHLGVVLRQAAIKIKGQSDETVLSKHSFDPYQGNQRLVSRKRSFNAQTT